MLTGELEPWDVGLTHYGLLLLLAGFIAALVSPNHFWIAPIGIYAGQFAYAFAFLPLGPLWPIGLVFGAIYCIPALVGSACAFGLWHAWRRS